MTNWNLNCYITPRKPKMTIRSSVLENCCGVVELGHATGHLNDTSLYRELRAAADLYERGCYLYFTRTTQKKECQALKRASFTIIGKFKNPRSGNWILIWALLNAPLPSRTRTVRGPRAVTRRRTPAVRGGGIPARAAVRATARTRRSVRRR